jgi:uncharacterized protein YdaU (DUF1376 family)
MDAPSPLTNETHNIDGLDGFMLNTDKLMSSELWALATGDEFKAAVGLWCRAWKQNPAGSLPNDERILAAFSGAGKDWSKVRDVALRGFILCSDGRLYNKTLCEDVVRAALSKKKRNERTKAATEARNKERNDQRYVERDVEQETNVTESHRQDLTGHNSKESKKEDRSPPNKEIFSQAVETWNLLASEKNLPKVQRLTDTRKSHLAARLQECGGLEGWNVALSKVRDSPFLTGQNDRNWCADFDFILQQNKFTKLMEGKYDGKTQREHTSPLDGAIESVRNAIDRRIAEASQAEGGQ